MRNLRSLRLSRITATLAALAALSSLPLRAAEPPRPTLYMLHTEVVNPSQVKVYEDTTKEFIGLVHQHHDVVPSFYFTTVMGDDFNYFYATPVADFAAIGAIYPGIDAVGKAVGETKWWDMWKRNGAAIQSIRESIVLEVPELSYAPAHPRLKPEEQRFIHYDLYYVQPGRDADADAVAKDFAALFRKKEIPDGYRMFKVVLGPDMPLLVVLAGARDAEDYALADAKTRAALGAEGEALFGRAFALTRRLEHRSGWVRPDLSLPPMSKTSQ